MQFCLELRASGASYSQIGKSLSPSVSKQRAFRIVQKALDGLIQQCNETAERVRQLELYRLDRMRLALDPKKFDPRVADTLIRISERVAKLHREGRAQTKENIVQPHLRPTQSGKRMSQGLDGVRHAGSTATYP